ncbi:GNAT family N-acetyltransferase [Cellulomonas sp. SLBN-39]|uniref:GNAT family N-acetyltransferase n=1 Tax=Cellulomonas sp. SLBN-39 TaxID=2768446 RepID=UPI00116FE0FF|nr:GNAT family N-acetyltransferase [Cellulomonas sp. SLBN-39]TQL02412.1 acetyltransferase (GNAT) family protein [Cellulomonas sp. SLBN-39]
MPPPDQVGRLRPQDRTEAAAVLAAALGEDPGFSHIFRDPARRQRELRAVYRLTLADALRYGHVLVTSHDGEITGVLVLYGPGAYPMAWWRWVRQAHRVLRIAVIAREHSPGIIRFGALTSKGVPRDAWYVEAFGVRPDRQREGRGSVLMRAFGELADGRREPSYLETTKPDNVGYYLARGYDEIGEHVPISSQGPWIYPMTRPAADEHGTAGTAAG